ncbi:CHC2 zinc finger [Thermoanaerobacter thermohydrosulfuricus]|uniref:CHC2 zinc finger n=1 Tax=Thermoanaerobacter thermohydrosulfuricus TaxID=1516 RepID=A0A1G7LS35_THETY|nr:DUF3854 domain-containing protein [Thermoanaerobacter thermohydrosulfuricus]SDF51769.1 CHC2 zinc finger [Thermoanaerobacter thermohydrosulfuricus]
MSYEKISILDVAYKCGIKILRKINKEEYLARCPFCGDSENPEHGHLYLNTAKDAYHCVRCGAGGYAVGLYAACNRISTKEAYKKLISQNNRSEKKIPLVQNIQKENTAKKIADIETRDKTYTALLSKLTLEKEHLKNLLKRGLSWEIIALNGYRSLPTDNKIRQEICHQLITEGHVLEGVPGFYTDRNNNWNFVYDKGFLIPVKNVQGKIQGLQIRLDNTRNGKYKWFSSNGLKNGTSAHAWQGIHGGPSEVVIITEGPLKADVAHYLSRLTFVSVPGVTAIKGIEMILAELGAKKVYIAYDMDLLINKGVQKAKAKLEEKLTAKGFKVYTKTWDPAYKGIDDYLLAQRKKEQRKIV